jgi:hypothetical protein
MPAFLGLKQSDETNLVFFFNIHRSVHRNIFLYYNQQDAPVISKYLFLFRTVFPSIIWSSKLRIQQLFDIYRCCVRSFKLLMMDEKRNM